MRPFSSLSNRIFVASALLAVLSIGAGIYNVNAAVTVQAERELRRGLEEARTLLEEHRRVQVEQFTREARLIADLPRLKAAVEPYHPSTVLPIVEEYQDQLAADLFIVTDRRGHILARLPDAESAVAGEDLAGVRQATTGREAATLVPYAEGILQVISVPIWINPDAPEILGTLNIGFSLDRHAAARLRNLTNSDVAFGVGDRIQASTIPAAGWPELAPLLAREGLWEQVRVQDQEYIAMTLRLGAGGGVAAPTDDPAVGAIVLRSRTERLAFLRPLHQALLFTAAVAVLAAIVLSYGIARTVTRPLGTITATMREMAATGDLTHRIPLSPSQRWEDEDARLLATTFNTMTDSIERFQREAAQRERLSSLGRLSTIVAHEIRNPLMIIKAALRPLRREGIQGREVAAAVADIDEEIARLNRIVAEVLDFARPIRFDLAPADLNALAADAIRASGAESGALPVRLALAPDLPPIVTDAERLRLVLVNLLANARQAVAAKDGAAAGPDAITLSTRRGAAGRVVVEVRDRGAGIAPEDLPRVFDPYFTTRRTGAGLGLAISRNVVEGLQGTIAVESRPGDGTVVRLEIPIR